jgi:hypothetical protein
LRSGTGVADSSIEKEADPIPAPDVQKFFFPVPEPHHKKKTLKYVLI